MEFFAIAQTPWDKEQLRSELAMANLEELCDSIEKTLESTEERGRYFTIWGEFEIIRHAIAGGYRFFMPGCLNSLTWSITTNLPPHPKKTTIHATINRTHQEPDFVETLEDFVNEWKAGLEKRGKITN
jgi:hypothetical protein